MVTAKQQVLRCFPDQEQRSSIGGQNRRVMLLLFHLLDSFTHESLDR